MNIKSAVFVKSIAGPDEILGDGIPQVAFIGRSNVGKSSVINTLVNIKNLARTSPTPGRTRTVNFFLINNSFYLVDLPGYGFAKASLEERQAIQKMIYWYLLFSGVDQRKIVLIIDAEIGPSDYDLDTIRQLTENNKNIVIVANKIDKIKKSALQKQLDKIQKQVGSTPIIPYSAEKKIGVNELIKEITNE
ncbi:MAG: YihA family ribosome biogenesis GTP-binding protein [Candidatus Doudnabacteria bacterium]|nr:YihA family ribosome biogenesis GTP-binding protein [Candidatus Doudnabacteria bacterium]